MKRLAAFLTFGSMLLMLCACGNKPFSDNPDAMAKASTSIVTIEIYDRSNTFIGTGSGFVAFDPTTVVTNFHVIEEAYRISVVDEIGTKSDVINILAYNQDLDIALLEIDPVEKYDPLTLSDNDSSQKGEKVVAIGSPLGISNTISNGTLSSFVEIGGNKYIQFTAPISHGSSGGALFNDDGVIIGVTSASLIEGQNMNLAIPISYVIDLHSNGEHAKQSVENFYSMHHHTSSLMNTMLALEQSQLCPKIMILPTLGKRQNLLLRPFITSGFQENLPRILLPIYVINTERIKVAVSYIWPNLDGSLKKSMNGALTELDKQEM